MTQAAKSPLDALPVDRLKEAGQDLLKTLIDRAVSAALDQVDGLTDRLGDVAENPGAGLSSALGGGGDGGGGGIGGALSSAGSALKGALGNVVPGLGGGDDGDEESDEESGGGGGSGGNKSARGKFKFLNIFEVQDVGVPLRLAYDQWTQFADFPSFMKKVENVDQSSDEKVTWKAQVFWSHRTWETTIVEQIPDSHILWTSSGGKGHASGIVTFSELAPNLTRIVLIMEYYPQGLFEKTGNIWRAVGRRARLEFKHFCRHVMMDSLVNRDQIVGWRGEIRDSEVVRTHEEALEDEQAAEDEDGYDDEDVYDESEDALDDADDAEELDEDEEPADEPVAEDDLDEVDEEDVEEPFEDEDGVEDLDEDYDDEDGEDAGEPDDSDGRPARGRSRRAERANA